MAFYKTAARVGLVEMSYLSRIFRTGAVRKTPKRIIRRILSELPDTSSLRLLEFGAGKGEISLPIDAMMQAKSDPTARFDAIELEADFAVELQKQLQKGRVVEGNALDFEQLIGYEGLYDVIVSSMPLSFFSRPELKDLLARMQQKLAPGGKILILYHAGWLTKHFRSELPDGAIVRFFTLPPYFLYSYQKK